MLLAVAVVDALHLGAPATVALVASIILVAKTPRSTVLFLVVVSAKPRLFQVARAEVPGAVGRSLARLNCADMRLSTSSRCSAMSRFSLT